MNILNSSSTFGVSNFINVVNPFYKKSLML